MNKIIISVGRTVRSKTWKNKKLSWAEIVEKLSKATVTNETYNEYLQAPREEKGKIKDVGGYVGGYLRNGIRKPENVVHRQLITLDLDFAHLAIWEDFQMIYSNAAVLHATHSHSQKTPKYRLIMPLNREVSSDEYVAIARKIAGDIGIDYFDNTGFQPYRLMFWPSVSKDVEYYFKHQDGPFLSADEILDSYEDWTDSSLYPVTSGQDSAIRKQIGKQKDPLEKSGLIGAFCRTYDIHETIENFLTDVYKTCHIPDRYTYTKGSTSAGVVTYDDKFAYSHHGTDPISGMLCNAFDLVRVHLFGHLDTDASNSKASTKEMEIFCQKDEEVKKTLAKDNLHHARYDFEDEEDIPDGDALEWTKELEVDRQGKYLSSAHNLRLIFANDPKLKGLFQYNTFDRKNYLSRSAPWRRIQKREPLLNVDYSGIRQYVELVYGIVSSGKIDDVLSLELNKNAFHPIREYLDSLTWDGEERIEELLIKYFGVKENIYTREAIVKVLVGAVGRIYDPGCKFDLVLTIVGEQGDGKSTFIDILGRGWASDSFHTLKGKDAFEQLQGAWLIEMAELSGLRKADVETIKHFITKREDTYRPAYGRDVETYPRQCIFIATTNKATFLTDTTGNRRFMPVDVVPRRVKGDVRSISREEINQIWAEAVERYQTGEPLYLSDEANKIANKERTSHREIDERIGLVEDYLNRKLPANWPEMSIESRRAFLELDDEEPQNGYVRTSVCCLEIWTECFNQSPDKMDQYKSRSINDIMRLLPDWEVGAKLKNIYPYGRQRYYFREIEK